MPLTHSRLKPLLYLICMLADFSAFVVIFAVSRGLAEQQAPLWYLGLAGAAFAFSSGTANVLSGWLSHRFDSRIVFSSGAVTTAIAVLACGFSNTASVWFLPGYCLLGTGLGCMYPTLIGWLNQDQDAHSNRRGVSRTLIVYCVSWNVGMMCGQMTAGSLFDQGLLWIYAVAFGVAIFNVVLALLASQLVTDLRPGSAIDGDTADDEMPRDAMPVTDSPVAIAARFQRLSWIANLGGTFGGSLIFHLLPDLAVTIGVPADDHGSLLAYSRSVVIVTYLMMHFVGFWHYRFSTSVASQVLGVIGLLVIARAESALALFIGLTLHAQLMGYNYFSGLFYSTAGSSQDRRTLAAGLHEATLAVGMAIGTFTGGILGSMIGQRIPYQLAAVVLSVLIAVQTIAWWKWRALRAQDSSHAVAE